MACKSWRQSIGAYVDGQAGALENLSVLAHLRFCRPCQGELRLAKALKGALRALPAPPVPEDLWVGLERVSRPRRASGGLPLPLTRLGLGLTGVFAAAGFLILCWSWIDREELSVELMVRAHHEYEIGRGPLGRKEI
ncbi:MAG: zf-HC2 domain-containing protein [Elusimicrobia bacterium]|nr:zf-HC2 domain-containing protein [Elusimicrobiota bacterium]